VDAGGFTDVGENRARAESIGAPPGRKHYFNVIVVSSFPLVRAVPYLSRGRAVALGIPPSYTLIHARDINAQLCLLRRVDTPNQRQN